MLGCSGDPLLTEDSFLDDLKQHDVELRDDPGVARPTIEIPQLPSSGVISLADLLALAEAHNPSLAASRSAIGEAAGQRWQASLYPNPTADVTLEDISLRDGPDDAKTMVGVSQPIIIGTRREAAMNTATAEQSVRMAEVEALRRSVFSEVAIEHVRIVALHERIRLCQELRQTAAQTLRAAESRFEARAAPEADVIRPRVEVRRLDAAIRRLEQERATSAKQLGLLVGGIELDPMRIEGTLPVAPPTLDVEKLQAGVGDMHPDMVVSAREIDSATARLSQARAERTPDLDIRFAAGYRGENDDAVVELGAGITLPLFDARQGDILTARFSVMRAHQQRIAVQSELRARLSLAIGEYEAARTELEAYRDAIVPDAQRVFELTQEGYRGGHSSFLDLLDAQRTLTETRMTLVELAADAAAASARIGQVVGPDPLAEAMERGSGPKAIDFNPQLRPQGAETNP